jgi:hypothetical protein
MKRLFLVFSLLLAAQSALSSGYNFNNLGDRISGTVIFSSDDQFGKRFVDVFQSLPDTDRVVTEDTTKISGYGMGLTYFNSDSDNIIILDLRYKLEETTAPAFSSHSFSLNAMNGPLVEFVEALSETDHQYVVQESTGFLIISAKGNDLIQSTYLICADYRNLGLGVSCTISLR